MGIPQPMGTTQAHMDSGHSGHSMGTVGIKGLQSVEALTLISRWLSLSSVFPLKQCHSRQWPGVLHTPTYSSQSQLPPVQPPVS